MTECVHGLRLFDGLLEGAWRGQALVAEQARNGGPVHYLASSRRPVSRGPRWRRTLPHAAIARSTSAHAVRAARPPGPSPGPQDGPHSPRPRVGALQARALPAPAIARDGEHQQARGSADVPGARAESELGATDLSRARSNPALAAGCPAQGCGTPLPQPVKVVGVGSAGVDYLASVAAYPRPDEKLRTETLEVGRACAPSGAAGCRGGALRCRPHCGRAAAASDRGRRPQPAQRCAAQGCRQAVTEARRPPRAARRFRAVATAQMRSQLRRAWASRPTSCQRCAPAWAARQGAACGAARPACRWPADRWGCRRRVGSTSGIPLLTPRRLPRADRRRRPGRRHRQVGGAAWREGCHAPCPALGCMAAPKRPARPTEPPHSTRTSPASAPPDRSELREDGVNCRFMMRAAGHPSPFTYIIVDRQGGLRQRSGGSAWQCAPQAARLTRLPRPSVVVRWRPSRQLTLPPRPCRQHTDVHPHAGRTAGARGAGSRRGGRAAGGRRAGLL